MLQFGHNFIRASVTTVIISIVCSFLVSTAFAQNDNQIPVQLNSKLAEFFGGIDPVWIENPRVGLEAPFPPKDGTSREAGYAVMLKTLNLDGSHRTKVYNCVELLRYDAEGMIASPEGTALHIYNLYGRCELLNFLANAKPSKYSHMRELDFEAEYAPFYLPNLVLSPNSRVTYAQILPSWNRQASMMTFRCVWSMLRSSDELDYQAYDRCTRNNGPYPENYKQEVRAFGGKANIHSLFVYDDFDYWAQESDGFIPKIRNESFLNILAKADIDGDGHEDWLLEKLCDVEDFACWTSLNITYTDDGMVPWGPDHRSYHWTSPVLFILTRLGPNRVAKMVNLCRLANKFLLANSRREVPHYFDLPDGCRDGAYYTPLPRRYWPDRTLDKKSYDWKD